MRGAAEANLDLAAANLEADSGAQNVRLARSNLLPQVGSPLSETFTREGTAEASLGQQPQRQVDGGLSMSVPLYSRAGLGRLRLGAAAAGGSRGQRDQVRLDVVLDAGEAYLTVLRARHAGRRAAHQPAIGPAPTSRSRACGKAWAARAGPTSTAGRARWPTPGGTSSSAEAQVRVAALELKRMLNRPLGQPLAQRPVTLDDPALLAQDSAVLAWLDDPARVALLTQFLVGEALRVSPELAAGRGGDRGAGPAAHRRGPGLLAPVAFRSKAGSPMSSAAAAPGSATPSLPGRPPCRPRPT